MNLVLLFEDDFFDAEKVVLSGRRATHILEIHRAKPGKILKVGLLGGLIGEGLVKDISENRVELSVRLMRPPPPPLPLTLIMALPRPKSFKKALHVAASSGVKRLCVIESWKVDKSYWTSPVLSQENIRDELILGLEQGIDTLLPEISFHRRFRPFAEDELPAIAANTLSLVADPRAEDPCSRAMGEAITLAIGPEGGFTEFELGVFRDQGFRAVSLGPRILRVEFAIAALTGRLF